MLKMMEAFSNAREYCAVDLWVKASNLIRTMLVYWGAWPRSIVKKGAPCKRDFDMLFVDGKPQVQELKLAVVTV